MDVMHGFNWRMADVMHDGRCHAWDNWRMSDVMHGFNWRMADVMHDGGCHAWDN